MILCKKSSTLILFTLKVRFTMPLWTSISPSIYISLVFEAMAKISSGLTLDEILTLSSIGMVSVDRDAMEKGLSVEMNASF